MPAVGHSIVGETITELERQTSNLSADAKEISNRRKDRDRYGSGSSRGGNEKVDN